MQLFSDVNSTLYFHKHRSKYNEINLNLLILPHIYNLHQPTNKLYSLLCQLCTLFIFKLPVFLIPPPHHQIQYLHFLSTANFSTIPHFLKIRNPAPAEMKSKNPQQENREKKRKESSR